MLKRENAEAFPRIHWRRICRSSKTVRLFSERELKAELLNDEQPGDGGEEELVEMLKQLTFTKTMGLYFGPQRTLCKWIQIVYPIYLGGL